MDGLERRGIARGRAVALLALAIVMIVSAFSFFILPPLLQQVSDLWKNLPNFRSELAKQMEGGGLTSRIVLPLLDLPRPPEFDAQLAKPLIWGPKALEVVAGLLILAILAGGALGGVIGAVLALPIVAAYPVFEKHWLDDYLHPDAVEDHLALRDTDGEESEAVVDAVMQGATPGK